MVFSFFKKDPKERGDDSAKGGPRTLARIHTPHDRAENIAGAGIAEVARVMR